MRHTTASLHPTLFAAIGLTGLVILGACGGQVEFAPTSSGTNTGGSSGTGSKTSTGSGSATGGAGGIGPLACAPGEGAIVIGGTKDRGSVAVLNGGAWNEGSNVVPGASQNAAYVDVYGRLSVMWIDPDDTNAHTLATKDGSAFLEHEVAAWHPWPNGSLFSPSGPIMVGHAAQGIELAYYDSDAMDWMPWVSSSFDASSAALASLDGSMVFVGLGPNHELCDVVLDSGIQWGPLNCHADLPVVTGGEIPLPRPQVVPLPNGDVVAVYYQPSSSLVLAATVRHAGQWSQPIATTSSAVGPSFGATVTPSGDVIVGVISDLGVVASIRFTPGVGWATPIAIGNTAFQQSRIAAAPGICGDDALIAFAGLDEVGDKIFVARVRGDSTATDVVGLVGSYEPLELSIATLAVLQ